MRPSPVPVAVAALCLLAAPGAGHVAGEQPASAAVTVRANAFQPFDVTIARGGTVTWTVHEGGHTIVADDGRFHFRGDGTGLSAGEEVSFTFGDVDEVVRYHCSIHGGRGGQGMAGIVVVGDPRPEPLDTPVLRVPEDIADLAEAVAVVPEGGRVQVAPGAYHVDGPLLIDRPRITVVGTGDTPDDVEIVARVGTRGLAPAVVQIAAREVTVANVTLRGAAGAGVLAIAVEAVGVRGVVVEGQGLTRDGIRLVDARGAGLVGLTVRGVRRAGVEVTPCVRCGVLIDRARTEGGLVGVLVSGARGVTVRRSTVTAAAAGIVARAADGRPSTVEVLGNRVATNTSRHALPDPNDVERRLATGAGIWLDGATDSVVADNAVGQQRFGIVVTGGAAEVTVADNLLRGTVTDLSWDGVGANVCFVGHDGDTDTEPPAIEDLYPCDRATAGVPWPIVTAALIQEAYR